MKEININDFLLEVDSNRFVELIQEAVNSGSLAAIDSVITLFSAFCYDEKQQAEFPEEVFQELIAQMGNSEFHALPDSHSLISLFQNDWGRLSDQQRQVLIESIEDSFLLYEDDLSCFIFAEILGENYSNFRAYEVLSKHITVKSETKRAYVAYGFGMLARNAKAEMISQKAKSDLKSMASDSSNVVRVEAESALEKLRKLI